MDNKKLNTPRVVRTGPKTTGKHRKKPATKGTEALKSVFFTIGKVILTTILVLTITGCIVGTALTIYVMEFIDSDATINLNMLKMNFTSSIYGIDENGENVEVQSLRSGENRIWVDLAQIPKYVQDAFVYSEDERFYTHKGVDFKRTFFALGNEMLRTLKLTSRDKFGASTITQQLIKNINGDFENRGIDKKIQEIVQSMNLDRHASKGQILELYLNYVGLNYNVSGVQAGSKYYFNKDVSELTFTEAASLAVTTKSPVNYNPKSHPVENKKRRKDVALKKMLEFSTITQAEYDSAIKEELVIDGQSTATDGKDDSQTAKKKVQSWFVDAVIEEVVDDLCKEYNYSKEYAEQLLYTGGYQVYTTMEIKTQSILDKFFEDEKTFAIKNVKPKDIPDAAMVIMNYDGNICAMAGGKGEKTGNRIWNDATMTTRPAGSTIKPLAIYTPAFENNLITWSSIMEDAPVKKIKDEKTGVERDYPKNYNSKYEGPISIINALKVSKNTIPVQLCLNLTPQVCFDFVYQELGLKSLIATGPNNNINEGSLALGDGGVKLNELTAAFQIFGNGGYFIEPKMYTKVTDAEGKVIINTTTRSKKQVMSPQTAYIMNKGLWSVVNDGGSGRAAKLSNMETIGKTGTSNDRKDLLFMGCTPYYVAGIRYGHDDNKLTITNSLGSAQIPVWQKIMTEVHKGKNPANFALSDEGIVKMEYCTESGNLAHSGCPKKAIGYYKIDDIPPACITHVQE